MSKEYFKWVRSEIDEVRKRGGTKEHVDKVMINLCNAAALQVLDYVDWEAYDLLDSHKYLYPYKEVPTHSPQLD